MAPLAHDLWRGSWVTPGSLRSSAALLLALLALSLPAFAYRGRVVDAATGQPLANATVTSREHVVQSAEDGTFILPDPVERIALRAPGYARIALDAGTLQGDIAEIALQRFSPKAVYLSSFGVATAALREPALELIRTTELNALVIDVKGDRGWVAYRSDVALASEIGAQRVVTIRDLRELVQGFRQRSIYTIARIVVFKDNSLANARPHLAVRAPSSRLWFDRENLAWTDPFRAEVWDYNIRIAVEAAEAGFDEIQFDYVRFPDAAGLAFSKPNTEANRVAAIAGFLAEARRRLARFNVYLAADIFGYVCWNLNDTDIGQRLDALLPHVDYLSPMLYPSGFHAGIPGYRNPVAHPFEIVQLSLERARERTGVPARRFRPWLQAFRDYAFDHRSFGETEIRAQIRAAEKFGSNGWMLWNPSNLYSAAGLER